MSKRKIETQEQGKKSKDLTESKLPDQINIPRVKELTDKEKLEIYKEELIKKDKRIEDLERENKLLFELTMKNAKKRLRELELKTNNQ